MLRIARPGVAAGAAMLAAASLIIFSSQAAFALDEPVEPTTTVVGEQSAPPVESTDQTPSSDPADSPDPADPAGSTDPADAEEAHEVADPAAGDEPPVVDPSADEAAPPTDDPAEPQLQDDPQLVPPVDPVPDPVDPAVGPPVQSLTNSAPIAANDAYVTEMDTELHVPDLTSPLANDTDADGDSLDATVVSPPTHGILYSWGAGGPFVYVPNAGYTGTDTFTYKDNDGTVDGNTATVTITISYDPAVNHPPVAHEDGFTTPFNTPLVVSAPGVGANDTDADGDALVATQLFSAPKHGTIALNNDGSFVYTPDAGYVGSDDFNYKISDGSLWSSFYTWDSIQIGAEVDPAPIASDDSYLVLANGTLTVPSPGVFENDTDNGLPAEGQGLAWSAFATAHGTLVTSAYGGFTYTPDPGFVGPDSFTYQLWDGVQYSNVAAVVINVVLPIDDTPSPPPVVPGDPGTPSRPTGTAGLAFTGLNIVPALVGSGVISGLGLLIVIATAVRRRRYSAQR